MSAVVVTVWPVVPDVTPIELPVAAIETAVRVLPLPRVIVAGPRSS